MLGLYRTHTGQDREKILRDMERDLYMSPEAAKDYGLIDRVIEPRQLGRFASGLAASGRTSELPEESR